MKSLNSGFKHEKMDVRQGTNKPLTAM